MSVTERQYGQKTLITCTGGFKVVAGTLQDLVPATTKSVIAFSVLKQHRISQPLADQLAGVQDLVGGRFVLVWLVYKLYGEDREEVAADSLQELVESLCPNG